MLTVWNRPAEKAANKEASFALTTEQIAFRKAFGDRIAAMLSEPNTLESLGAFITPGKDEDKGTIMVALSLPVPAITFTDPDGHPSATRSFNLNVNAVIPAPEKAKTPTNTEPVRALTYAELRAKQLEAKTAKK
jgi:hypothetical protein